MNDFNKLADALENSEYPEPGFSVVSEAAALLRSAAGADVDDLIGTVRNYCSARNAEERCASNENLRTTERTWAALEARLRLLVAQIPRWLPIAEAPKDGTEVILGATAQTHEGKPVDPRVTIGNWLKEVEELGSEFHSTGAYLGQYPTGRVSPAGWMSWDGGFTEENPPTHYMPKPLPPAPKEPS